MKRGLFLALAVVFSDAALPWSLGCSLGTTPCIKSQGTEIPVEDAIEILDRCAEFTYRDIGRLAVNLSTEQVVAESRGHSTPLVQAWSAFEYLRESPLDIKIATYEELKSHCEELSRDFYDNSKWIK